MKKHIMNMLVTQAIINAMSIVKEYDELPDTIILQKPPPPGCKEYWFNAEGEFSTEQMRKTEVVFTCVASNDKNALRKFNKWKNNGKHNHRDRI